MAYSGNVITIRQNYHAESEAGLNRLINLNLQASYTFISMAGYYDRDDVALPGVAKCLAKNSRHRRDFGQQLMEYQNIRGGRIVLADIKKPERDDWGTVLETAHAVAFVEKNINQALLELHAIAGKHNDAQMSDFLETYFLEDSVKRLKRTYDAIATLKRVGPGLGEYQYDQVLLAEVEEHEQNAPPVKALARQP